MKTQWQNSIQLNEIQFIVSKMDLQLQWFITCKNSTVVKDSSPMRGIDKNNKT